MRSDHPRSVCAPWVIRLGQTLLCAFIVGQAARVQAQPASGAIVGGVAAAVVFNDATEVSVSGGIGYRLNRAIGFGIELTYLPKLEPTFPYALALPRPGIRFEDPEGNAVFFTTNVRIEIPTTSRRVLPYVIAGGGVASLTHSDVTIYGVDPLFALPLEVVGDSYLSQVFPFGPVSTTGLALTLGGGASVLVNDHLSVDIDLRTFHLRGTTTGQVGRFGIGASYRF